MDDDDWDLHAVVRGYSSAAITAAASPDTTTGPSFQAFSPPAPDQVSTHFLTDSVDTNDPFQGLQEVYRELRGGAPPPVSATVAASAVSVPTTGNVFQPRQELMQMRLPPLPMNNVQSRENIEFSNPGFVSSSSHNFPPTNVPQPIRQRRRKNQQMKVVRRMTQEELSADSWAWRKYGQKPIKGSLFPRNYYRCSTSKGCAARKQVERSPNDPGIFVVSYTGEHTHPRPSHRSALSGSTRNKLSSPPFAAVKNDCKVLRHQDKGLNISSSSSSPASFSKGIALVDGGAVAENDHMADEKEAAGDRNASDSMDIFLNNPNEHLCVNDDHEDVFRGFHDSDDHSSGGGGDLFSGGLLSSPPWTPTSSATFHGGHQ